MLKLMGIKGLQPLKSGTCLNVNGVWKVILAGLAQLFDVDVDMCQVHTHSIYASILIPAVICRYVLSNIESKQGVRKGDRIWQIAFGSGFKCNSAVWRAMRSINDQHPAWVEAPAVAEA